MNPVREKPSFRKKIIWLTFIPAVYLHTMADSEILGSLAKSHEVHLICPYFTRKRRLKNLGIHVIAIPIADRRPFSVLALNIALFFFLPFYFVIRKPDFVITKPDGTIFGFISALLLKRHLGDRGFKVVLDIRSTPVGTHTHLFDLTISLAKKTFDGITIITPLMKREICQKFGIDPDFVGVWSSGASTTLFRPERYILQAELLRKKLGLSGKFIVLYHGDIRTNRGLTETANAFQLIAQEFPDIVFFLLGKGSAVPYLRKFIQEKKLQNVIIHDPVDYFDVPVYIAMCDVGIVPLPNISFWRYQCPLKILEYIAMEKVVVLTDIPAHREIAGDKEFGVYISSINPAEIADGIRYAYENREKLKEWGALGRDVVIKNYNWEKAAGDLGSFLSTLKNGSRGR